MLKMIALAVLAALVAACAGPAPGVAGDPLKDRSGSTASGESTAADLGFHGPAYREKSADGPN